MLWAAATMCFFGFLRMGEVVTPSDSDFDASSHLMYTDVRLDNREAPQYLQVRIKASKTDPFRKGVSGRTGGNLCPVAAILNYMVQRGSTGGPFFTFAEGRALTRARFVTAVRTALTVAGFDCSLYAGHSFRFGAATTAARRGIHAGLTHQDHGVVGERGVHGVHQDSPRNSMRRVKYPRGAPEHT